MTVDVKYTGATEGPTMRISWHPVTKNWTVHYDLPDSWKTEAEAQAVAQPLFALLCQQYREWKFCPECGNRRIEVTETAEAAAETAKVSEEPPIPKDGD